MWMGRGSCCALRAKKVSRRWSTRLRVATMGFKTDGTIVDEATPVSLDDMIGHYKRSKFLAEQEAIAAARAGQHVMILNPTTPIGPGDAKPTPTGRIVVDFLNRKFPAYVDTGLNLVDVDEVARMHVVALERGTPGERYILGGENLTLKQILDRHVCDHGAAFADDEGAACGGDGVRVLRRERLPASCAARSRGLRWRRCGWGRR